MVSFWMLLLLGTWLCSLSTGRRLRPNRIAFENRRRFRYCIYSAKLVNGELVEPRGQLTRLGSEMFYKIKTVSCKTGYLMNVKNIDDVWFKCTDRLWQAQDRDNYPLDLYLNNVTCQEKTKCEAPLFIKNGHYIIKERFCLDVKGLSKCAGTYNSGDKIKYVCDIGYQAPEYIMFDPYEDFYWDVYDYANDTKTFVLQNLEFECQKYLGQWDNGKYMMYRRYPVCEKIKCPEPVKPIGVNVHFLNKTRYVGDVVRFSCDYKKKLTGTKMMTCLENGLWDSEHCVRCTPLEIICNASRFENMTDGDIKNFTPLYEYGAILELECDPGFKPIKLHLLQCLDQAGFETAEFGCTKTKCPEPVKPIGGSVFFLNETRYVGDMVRFSCDYEKKLTGPKMMTCLENGQWDSEHCVRCTPIEIFCNASRFENMTNGDIKDFTSFYEYGAILELECDPGFQPIKLHLLQCLDPAVFEAAEFGCTRKSDPLKSMISADSLTKAMQSFKNSSNQTDDGGIDIGQIVGADVFLILDVSCSINAKEFEIMKQFALALASNLNVSDASYGTRLMVYTFASATRLLFNGHGYSASGERILENKEDAFEELNKILNLATIRAPQKDDIVADIGQGIEGALRDISIGINSKKAYPNRRSFSQQVVVLISNGQFKTDARTTEAAQRLKDMDVQIYSIYLGSSLNKEIIKSAEREKKTMKDLASSRRDEEHYFEINPENIYSVINAMIKTSSESQCGNPAKTNLNDVTSVKQYIDAEPYAWPWMVRITTHQGRHICGGSLIDKKHVLTAAHCLHEWNGELSTKGFKLIIGANKVDVENRELIEEEFDWTSITVHKDYNQRVKPTHLYDIAVVTLKKPIETYNYAVLPICIPDENKVFDDAIQEKTYGISTGWGRANTLQQMQLLIKNDNDCLIGIDDRKDQFNSTYMFCAGGEGMLDIYTQQGDGGNPFIIEDPNKENTFVQIGIVSFDIRGGQYGFYTKLKELREWIRNTINDQEDKKVGR